MNAILQRVGDLMTAAYLPLLVLNIVALLVIYGAQKHRWAQWPLYVFLGLNTPY